MNDGINLQLLASVVSRAELSVQQHLQQLLAENAKLKSDLEEARKSLSECCPDKGCPEKEADNAVHST